MKVLGDFGDQLDLQIKQGSTFGPHQGVISNPDDTPVDLTGCELRAQLRRNPGDSSVVTFDVEITDPAEGEFTFELTKEQTATLSPPKYQWDMELEDAAGRVTPICFGDVLVALEVTR